MKFKTLTAAVALSVLVGGRRLDLAEYLEEHCLDFDRQAYWSMAQRLDRAPVE